MAGPQGTLFSSDGQRLHASVLKKQRKTPKPPVPQDPVSRQGVLLLRRDLQLYDPDADPKYADVPDIFGGESTVEEYTERVYPEAISTLGLSLEVGYSFV